MATRDDAAPNWKMNGLVFSALAGVAGAVGAICVIFASKGRSGAKGWDLFESHRAAGKMSPGARLATIDTAADGTKLSKPRSRAFRVSRSRAALWLTVLACALTAVWFPTRYWDVVALEPAGWLVLVRNLLLLGLAAVLVAAIARAREPARSA